MAKINLNIHHLMKVLNMLNFLKVFFTFLLHYELIRHLKALDANFFLKKVVFLFLAFFIHHFRNLIPYF